MRILQVVHGYPPRYNAGSEVYTQMLAHTLARDHQVMVFSRFENPYSPAYAEREETDLGVGGNPIPVRLVNMPHFRDRYRHRRVDEIFIRCVHEFAPDVVHVQHLNHLSTSLVMEAARRDVSVAFTLHDFWLMCPRGQFIQFFSGDGMETFGLCDGQDDSKCASRCYAPRYGSGTESEHEQTVGHFTEWVGRRMAHLREVCAEVDLFIAPSRQLGRRFMRDFAIPESRIAHLDYGFDLKRLAGRERLPEQDGSFVFGYIGTHVPAKGISQLLEAFASVRGNARLRIWGRAHPESTPALREMHARLPAEIRNRVTWEGEYPNQEIVARVLNRVDAIVVPSIWLENSPLVIHEAQQARVPVITADAGGMAELVAHEGNGLLFKHRDTAALALQMARFVDKPEWAARLGRRGYLHNADGDVCSMEHHTSEIIRLYEQNLRSRVGMKPEVPA